MEKRELVIIGAGPAGLSAAIYGKRAGLDTLVLEKGRPGGQILTTSRVENYPGILDGTGTGLADAFRAHAEFFKAEFRSASVQKLEVRGEEKVITLKDGSEIAAGAVIVATGAYFRKQGCPGEKKYTGMGVSYCAVCDAAFFEDLEVAVIGGGNTAVEEACYLTGFASKVYIVHRRDEFRADLDASLPLVATLLDGGMAPGAGIAFLITGAGTSVGAISGMLVIARWRIVALVIGTLLVTATAAGWLAGLWL